MFSSSSIESTTEADSTVESISDHADLCSLPVGMEMPSGTQARLDCLMKYGQPYNYVPCEAGDAAKGEAKGSD